jgi:hypothetical protein
MKNIPMNGNVEHIKQQAMIIQEVAQRVIDACDNKTPIDAYARNKLTGGGLAQDAAVLAIMLIQYECDEENA